MNKISSREIIDVIKYTQDKIILVEKKPLLESTQYKANYFIINLLSGEKEVITKSAYLLKKFGSSYQKIIETIANFVQCDAYILKNRSVFVIYPNGQCGLFDANGEFLWSKEMTYNDKTVSSLAPDGDYIWCVCREENCVLRYSCDNFKVDLRIGSKEAPTFESPSFLSADERNIYVCCANKLRSISKSDFVVSDVTDAIPNLKKFFRFGDYSLICTSDGAYIANDE